MKTSRIFFFGILLVEAKKDVLVKQYCLLDHTHINICRIIYMSYCLVLYPLFHSSGFLDMFEV